MATESELGTIEAAAPYAGLMHSYLRDELTAESFADDYVDRYLSDNTMWDDPIFDVLDRIFAYADDLELDTDEQARDELAVPPARLRVEVQRAVERLAELGVRVAA